MVVEFGENSWQRRATETTRSATAERKSGDGQRHWRQGVRMGERGVSVHTNPLAADDALEPCPGLPTSPSAHVTLLSPCIILFFSRDWQGKIIICVGRRCLPLIPYRGSLWACLDC
jgi:hypothetical protein